MAKIEKIVLRWFQMSDDVWERHANPLSVWTRLFAVPILALAIWSRAWIGHWAWCPVLITLLWFWLNPRVFPKPSSVDHWASMAIFGERLWLNRGENPIADHHTNIISITNTIAACGALLCLYGLVYLNPYHVSYGVSLLLIGKSWFLDRMVWLYHEHHTGRHTSPAKEK